jgi:hypothetical protein
MSFNFCAQDEHVPEIERFVRTVKDRARSAYNSLPFEHIPRLMVISLIANSVFWLNAFPRSSGVSDTLSPRYLLTGKQLDYTKHVRLEFGSYVQTHEEHSNDMRPRTIGAICLGPTGNEQGGHYFMSLATGRRLLRNRWTELPMPHDAIERVNEMGRRQKMPKTLTFADRFGFELPDAEDDVDDDHDSNYDPADDDDASDDSSDESSMASSHSSDDDDDDGDDGIVQPLPGLSAGVDDSSHHDDEAGSDNEESDDSDNDADDDDDSDDDSGDADDDASESLDEEEEATPPSINIPDETISSPSMQRDVTTQATSTPSEITGVDESSTPSEITGVDESTETAGVVQPEAGENAGVDRESEQD